MRPACEDGAVIRRRQFEISAEQRAADRGCHRLEGGAKCAVTDCPICFPSTFAAVLNGRFPAPAPGQREA